MQDQISELRTRLEGQASASRSFRAIRGAIWGPRKVQTEVWTPRKGW